MKENIEMFLLCSLNLWFGLEFPSCVWGIMVALLTLLPLCSARKVR